MANNNCGCNFNVKCVGTCDVARLNFDGSKKDTLNWTEISVPEILTIPARKPDMEDIDQVYANVSVNCVKLIETPFAYKSYDILVTDTGELDTINGLVAGLQDTIDDLIGESGTAPVPGTGLTGIIEIVKAILILPDSVNEVLKVVENILAEVQPAVDALLAAVDKLVATLALNNITAVVLCAVVDLIESTAKNLLGIINSIIPAIQNLIDSIIANVPVADLIVAAISAILGSPANPSADPPTAATGLYLIVDGLVATLQDVIDIVVEVDFCEETKAFEIIGNAEGTCLSGRKLIIEGQLNQKVVYTADADVQSVHSANYEMPFIAFIIPYAKFEGLAYEENIEVFDTETNGTKTISGYRYNPNVGINIDLCEEFCINPYIEDIYVHQLNSRTIFKNVTVFIKAKSSNVCL